MKLLEGFLLRDAKVNRQHAIYYVKLQRSLYGLKYSRRMWYNRLSEFIIKQGFINNEVCPCIFIRVNDTWFVFIAVYVDDLNLIGSPKDKWYICKSDKRVWNERPRPN